VAWSLALAQNTGRKMITEHDLEVNPRLAALVRKAQAKENRNAVMRVATRLEARPIYIFDITPIGKPRMTRRDKWPTTRTKAAAKYMVWRNELEGLAIKHNFILADGVQIIFLLPVSPSWSKKMRDQMRGKPHQIKPDADNMLKGFIDALCKNDQKIYDKHVLKFWWDTGKIIVLRNKPLYTNLLQINGAYDALQERGGE